MLQILSIPHSVQNGAEYVSLLISDMYGRLFSGDGPKSYLALPGIGTIVGDLYLENKADNRSRNDGRSCKQELSVISHDSYPPMRARFSTDKVSLSVYLRFCIVLYFSTDLYACAFRESTSHIARVRDRAFPERCLRDHASSLLQEVAVCVLVLTGLALVYER